MAKSGRSDTPSGGLDGAPSVGAPRLDLGLSGRLVRRWRRAATDRGQRTGQQGLWQPALRGLGARGRTSSPMGGTRGLAAYRARLGQKRRDVGSAAPLVQAGTGCQTGRWATMDAVDTP